MTSLATDLERAHAYLDQLPPAQLRAIRSLLASMVDPVARTLGNAPPEDEEISGEEEQAVAQSKQWFKQNKGIPFEDVVTELGFTMDQVCGDKDPT